LKKGSRLVATVNWKRQKTRQERGRGKRLVLFLLPKRRRAGKPWRKIWKKSSGGIRKDRESYFSWNKAKKERSKKKGGETREADWGMFGG